MTSHHVTFSAMWVWLLKGPIAKQISILGFVIISRNVLWHRPKKGQTGPSLLSNHFLFRTSSCLCILEFTLKCNQLVFKPLNGLAALNLIRLLSPYIPTLQVSWRGASSSALLSVRNTVTHS